MALILLGVGWIILGVEAWKVPVFEYLHHEIWTSSAPARAAAWVSSGLFAIATAFRPKGTSDAFAWPLLYSLPAFRGFTYFVAWIDHMLPGLGNNGYPYGWIYVVIFGTLAIVVVFLSGWPEPYPPKQPFRGLRSLLVPRRFRGHERRSKMDA